MADPSNPYYVPDAPATRPDPYYVPDSGGGKPDPYYVPEISLEDAVNLEKLRRTAEAPPIPQPGVISGGLSAGWNQLQSSGAGLVGDLATIANLPTLKQWADTQQDIQSQEAAQYGRPDLENIRDQSLGTALPFVGYQVAKQVPLWAGALGASALTGSPAAGIALAGASGVGEMYGQAREAGIENKPGVALGALGLGVPYGYLETLTPYALEKGFLEGFSGDLGKRALKGFASGFGKESLTEAAQTGLEMAFRPDLPIADKAQNVIDAALTGGLVGGSLGGVTGALSKKPAEVTDQDLKADVDGPLGLPPPNDGVPPSLPPPDEQLALPAPPLGLPAPQPTPMGSAPESIFAEESDQQLLSSLNSQEQAVIANPNDQTQAQLLREARAEIEKRQAANIVFDDNLRQQQNAADPLLAQTTTPEEIANVRQAQNFLDERTFDDQTASLFTEEDFDQTPAPSSAPVPTELGSGPTINLPAAEDLVSDQQTQTRTVNKTRDALAKDLLGAKTELSEKDRTYLESLNYNSRAEFASTLLDKLNDGSSLNKNEKLLAQSYNLLKSDGNTVTPDELLSSASKLERQANQQNLKNTPRAAELTFKANFYKELAQLRTQKEAAQAQQEETQAAYDTQFANLELGQQASLMPTNSTQSEMVFTSNQATPTTPVTQSVTQASPDQMNLGLSRNVSDAMIADYEAAAANAELGSKVQKAARDVLPALRAARAANVPLDYKNLAKADVVERALGPSPLFEQAQAAGIQIPTTETMIKAIKARYPRYARGNRTDDEIIQKYLAVKQPKQSAAPAIEAAPVAPVATPLPDLGTMSSADLEQELLVNNQTLPKIKNKQNLRKAVTTWRATQGAKNANEKSGAEILSTREPTTTSGPVGKRDAQGTTVTTESLSKGNTNEKSSSQSYTEQGAGQKSRPNQESSKEVSDQAPVASTPPVELSVAAKRERESIKTQVKQEIDRYRRNPGNARLKTSSEDTDQSFALKLKASRPVNKEQAALEIATDRDVSKELRDSMSAAIKTKDTARRDFLIRADNRVSVINNRRSLEQFRGPVKRALAAAIRNNDPNLFDEVFNEINKVADLERPSVETTVGVNRRPSKDQPTGRMTVEAVMAMLKPIISRWSGLPRVWVVSEKDPKLSDVDRAFLNQNKVFKNLGAFAWQNEKPVLVLNADKLTPGEVLPTLFHEALGHFGLRSAYGRELFNLLKTLYTTTPSIREAVDAYIKARPDLKAEIDSYDTLDADEAKVQLVEEVLTEQSEKGILKQGIFSQLKALVERFARMVGLRKGAFSKDEILSIIRVGQESALNPTKLTDYYLNQSYLDPRLNQAPARILDMNNNLRDAIEQAKQKFTNKINPPPKTKLAEWRNTVLQAMSLHHLAERYGPVLRGLQDRYNTVKRRTSDINNLAHYFKAVNESFDLLSKESKPLANAVVEAMYATAQQMNPRKSFDQQSEAYKKTSSPEELRQKKADVAQANKNFELLIKNPRALQVYENFRLNGELQAYSMSAQRLFEAMMDSSTVPQSLKDKISKFDRTKNTSNDLAQWRKTEADLGAFNKKIKGFNPFEGFKAQAGLKSDTPTMLADAVKYFKMRNDQMIAFAKEYAAFKDYENFDATKVNTIINLASATEQQRQMITEYPYFHLGRAGDYMLSFSLRSSVKGADGKPESSLADRQRAQQVLKENGFDFELVRASNSPKIFLRVATPSEHNTLQGVLNKLQSEGVIDKNSDIVSTIKPENVYARGTRPFLDSMFNALKETYNAQREIIEKSNLDDTQKGLALATADRDYSGMKMFLLDSYPDTSEVKILQRRKNIGGYMSDMIQAQAQRAEIWTLSLANLANKRAMSESMQKMRAVIKEEGRIKREDNSRQQLLQSIADEVDVREAILPFITGRTWHDTLAAWNHTYFLSLSPSFVALQFTQLGTTLWPRLVQDYTNVSFLDAARTIGKNTPAAMKVVKAMIDQGLKRGGWNWTDASVSMDVLNKTDLPLHQKEFILRFVNDGNIEVGGAAREQGRVATGQEKGWDDHVLRVASSFGYYSEVATRLVAALSAYELYTKTNGRVASSDVASYNKMLESVGRTVDGSMWNYNTANTARLLGKMGFAGRLTKVMMTFYTYTASLLEALSRAIMDGFVNGAALYPETERAERIKGARRFLGAHLTAMMIVSGSLGLPFASAVAAAINGLDKLFGDDDEPYDAVVAWRTFLASVFGSDVEKVLSKGAGRLAGVDFSSRTSEADIIPFTRLFADRRNWNDAGKDWAFNMFGAPLSMATNMLDGATEFFQGDHLGGAAKFAPTFLKGPFKAADMYLNQAYLDKKDNRLPNIAPEATDILKQTFGFTPANIQDVKDKDRYYQANQGVLSRRASTIRNNLASALENQDYEKFIDWRQQALDFTKANPTMDILGSLQRVLTMRAKERAGVTKEDYVKMQKYPF